MLSIATISASTILQICFRGGKDISSLSGGSSTLKTLVGGSTTEVKGVIGDRRISSCLAQLQKLDLPREKRRRINRKFVICLAAGQAKAFAKLKKLAKQKTAQQVIEDFTHSATSCKGQLKDNIEDLKDSVEKKYNTMSCTCSTGNGCCGHCSYQRQCCKPGPQPTRDGLGSKLFRLVKTIANYVDVVRDTVLVGLLITLTAFFSSDITLDFHNVIILILLATVVVPLLVSAIQTSWRHPLTIFEFPVWHNYRTNPAGRWEMARIRLLVFFGYVFVPSILIVNKEKAKLKQKIIEEQGKEEFDSEDGIVSNKTLEEQEQIEVYLDEVRKAYLIFKGNEAALELVVQQSVQLTMLLLSLTKYPVTAGLNNVFGKDYSSVENYLNLGDALLVMSVCWSLKTGVVSFLKIHSEQKAGMLSGAAKVVLGLRAVLFSVTRIGCVVAFFGPFLGLGDCMAHWHAEGIRLDPELLDNLLENLNSSSSYWDNQTVSLMYREQDYTNYTLVTLQAAFFIFLGVIFLHGIAIFILKMNVSTHFKSTGWLNKVGHVVESLHVPDVYKDFDVDLNPDWDRTPYDYRMSFDSVLKETLWMVSLQAVSNLLLLVPLLVTGDIKVESEI